MAFERDHVRHDLTVRRLLVTSVRRVVPNIVRVTLAGPELEGFTSVGPSDHLKVFFPDPVTGILTLPEVDAEGLRRGAQGTVISRDYTPRAFRPSAGAGQHGELDIDIVTHGVDGPASAWAQLAKPGDGLGIGGPRGSRLVPPGLARLIIVADDTALPAAARWLELVPTSTRVTGLFFVADADSEEYFDDESTEALDAEWITRAHGPGALADALRSLAPIDDDTYVFLAGEADLLVPLRRYLRSELALPAEQVSASGYWRRGITNLDHHAPLDPSDPD